MAILRILLVSLLAAICGCALASLILFGSIAAVGFLPLVFTLMGSFLLLAPGYGAAREAGLPLLMRYARLLLIGAGAGAVMLAVIFLGTEPVRGALIGAFYGSITAVCWVVFHLLAKQFSVRRT